MRARRPRLFAHRPRTLPVVTTFTATAFILVPTFGCSESNDAGNTGDAGAPTADATVDAGDASTSTADATVDGDSALGCPASAPIALGHCAPDMQCTYPDECAGTGTISFKCAGGNWSMLGFPPYVPCANTAPCCTAQCGTDCTVGCYPPCTPACLGRISSCWPFSYCGFESICTDAGVWTTSGGCNPPQCPDGGPDADSGEDANDGAADADDGGADANSGQDADSGEDGDADALDG